MRNLLLGIGIVLIIAGGLVFGGVIDLGSKDEVLRIGDAAVEVGEGRISVTDRGNTNRNIGIALLVVGGVGVVAGAMSRKR